MNAQEMKNHAGIQGACPPHLQALNNFSLYSPLTKSAAACHPYPVLTNQLQGQNKIKLRKHQESWPLKSNDNGLLSSDSKSHSEERGLDKPRHSHVS